MDADSGKVVGAAAELVVAEAVSGSFGSAALDPPATELFLLNSTKTIGI